MDKIGAVGKLLAQIAMHPSDFFCLFICRARHDFCRATFEIGNLDIVIPFYMPRVCQPERGLEPHNELIKPRCGGVTIFVFNFVGKVFCRFVGIKGLHRNIEFAFIHSVDKVLEHLFGAAAVQGLDKKQDFNHFGHIFRIAYIFYPSPMKRRTRRI